MPSPPHTPHSSNSKQEPSSRRISIVVTSRSVRTTSHFKFVTCAVAVRVVQAVAVAVVTGSRTVAVAIAPSLPSPPYAALVQFQARRHPSHRQCSYTEASVQRPNSHMCRRRPRRSSSCRRSRNRQQDRCRRNRMRHRQCRHRHIRRTRPIASKSRRLPLHQHCSYTQNRPYNQVQRTHNRRHTQRPDRSSWPSRPYIRKRFRLCRLNLRPLH